MDVFLLCGQSNMAGRGGVAERAWDGAVPPECEPVPGVWCLSADGSRWQQAQEPLHAGVDAPGKPCGIGPGLPFAAALVQRSSGAGAAQQLAVGLVPCAVGGSALHEWELPDGLLGRRAVERALASLAAPGAAAPARLAGVLWYQGETDAGSGADAASWALRFAAHVVGALRTLLRAPSLPFAVVAITTAPLPSCAHTHAVRAAQLGLALPHCCVVDAAGLPLQPDGLHLTTAGAVTLGRRLATAWTAHEQSGWKSIQAA
jgi:hypothetical protein